MKTFIITLILLTVSAFAGDIVVTLSQTGSNVSKVITTNETSFGRLNWDGIDGGGQHEITAVMENARVVITERTISSSAGIGSDTTSKTFIPTNKIPYTFMLAQTTVTVSRTESPLSSETDQKKPQQSPGE